MMKSSIIRLMAVSTFAMLILTSCHENQSADEPQQFDPQIDAIGARPLPAIDPGEASEVSMLSDPIVINPSDRLDATPSDSEESENVETAEDVSVDSSAETSETNNEDLPGSEDVEDSGPA